MRALLSFALVAMVAGNPIQKVLELLNNMQAKTMKVMQDTQDEYGKAVSLCKLETQEKMQTIETKKEDKQEEQANLAKSNSDIEEATTQIEELGKKSSEAEAAKSEATSIREAEHKTFVEAQKTLVGAVSALQRCIKILEPKSGSFLQTDASNPVFMKMVGALMSLVDAGSFSDDDNSKLTQLMQTAEEAGEGAKTMTRSSIMELLEDLLKKTEGNLQKTRNDEKTAVHKYQMLTQSLENTIKTSNTEMEKQKQNKAGAETAKAEAAGALQKVSAELTKVTDALEKKRQECMNAAVEQESQMKQFNAELTALAQTKKILQEMTGGAQKQQYKLNQESSDDDDDVELESFIQLSASTSDPYELLQTLSAQLNSPAIAQLAVRVRATSALHGPFDNVKKMITDMINTLEEENKKAASQKAFCDKEMAESKKKRKALMDEMAKLVTRLDEKKASIVKSQRKVQENTEQMSEIDSNVSQATKIRNQENKTFKEAKQDYTEGLSGVQQALKILREYYAKSEEGDNAPAQPDANSGAAGIIGLLEVAEADFSKSLAEAQSAEDQQLDEYESDMENFKVDKAKLEATNKGLNQNIAELQKASSETETDRSSTEDELDAANDYKKELDAKCIAKPDSYEEKKAKREAELEGLKNALEILESNNNSGDDN